MLDRFRMAPTITLLAALLAAHGAACSSASSSRAEAPDNAAATSLAPRSSSAANLPAATSEEETIFEYGRTCAQAMGVELPAIDCVGDHARRIPVLVDGALVTDRVPPECDAPPFVVPFYGCFSADLARYQQRNAKGEVVDTLAMCRGYRLRKADDPSRESISIIQHNTTTNEVCWFEAFGPEGTDSSHVPKPWAAGRVRGDAADLDAQKRFMPPSKLADPASELQCAFCHDNQVWVRSPFVQQLGPDALPKLVDREPPTSVGRSFAMWRSPEVRPRRLRIDAHAFDELRPPTAGERAELAAGRLATADACTSCHALGHSLKAGAAQGTCATVRGWARKGNPAHGDYEAALTKTGEAFARTHWMPPPSAGIKLPPGDERRAWERFYGRAMDALLACCDDPALAAPSGAPVCGSGR